MKCQSLFSGKKNKKNISICRLLKSVPQVPLNVKCVWRFTARLHVVVLNLIINKINCLLCSFNIFILLLYFEFRADLGDGRYPQKYCVGIRTKAIWWTIYGP